MNIEKYISVKRLYQLSRHIECTSTSSTAIKLLQIIQNNTVGTVCVMYKTDHCGLGSTRMLQIMLLLYSVYKCPSDTRCTGKLHRAVYTAFRSARWICGARENYVVLPLV